MCVCVDMCRREGKGEGVEVGKGVSVTTCTCTVLAGWGIYKESMEYASEPLCAFDPLR